MKRLLLLRCLAACTPEADPEIPLTGVIPFFDPMESLDRFTLQNWGGTPIHLGEGLKGSQGMVYDSSEGDAQLGVYDHKLWELGRNVKVTYYLKLEGTVTAPQVLPHDSVSYGWGGGCPLIPHGRPLFTPPTTEEPIPFPSKWLKREWVVNTGQTECFNYSLVMHGSPGLTVSVDNFEMVFTDEDPRDPPTIQEQVEACLRDVPKCLADNGDWLP